MSARRVPRAIPRGQASAVSRPRPARAGPATRRDWREFPRPGKSRRPATIPRSGDVRPTRSPRDPPRPGKSRPPRDPPRPGVRSPARPQRRFPRSVVPDPREQAPRRFPDPGFPPIRQAVPAIRVPARRSSPIPPIRVPAGKRDERRTARPIRRGQSSAVPRDRDAAGLARVPPARQEPASRQAIPREAAGQL